MANAVYLKRGTTKTFKDSGGDVAFTLTNLANGAGRISAQLDLGAAPQPYLYELRVSTQYAAALALGATMDVHISTSDGTTADAVKAGTSDAAVAASTSLVNTKMVGQLVADGTTDNDKQQASWIIPIYARYVQIALFNNMGQALEAAATYASYASLTPLYDEIQ
jgi:hypothetical protein